MNRSLPVGLALGLLSTLGSASAQQLSAYRQMAAALDRAVSVRSSGSAASLPALQEAQSAFALLRPTLSSDLIRSGLERSLQAAQAALGRSPADLEAQVTQARGLMRKALHDQTLQQLSSDPTHAAPQLGLLASEFALQGQSRSRFLAAAQGGHADVAARLLRQAAATRVQANLKQASVPQNDAQRIQTYLTLARATSWFTVIQDAPEVAPLQVSQFGAALRELTGHDDAALGTTLVSLKAGSTRLVQAVQQSLRPPASTPTAVAPVKPATTTKAAPAVVPAVSPAVTPSTSEPVTPVPDAAPVSTPPETLPSESGASDAVYAGLGRALVAAGHADTPLARTALMQAGQALNAAPPELRSTPRYTAFAAALVHAQNQNGLRPAEVQALIGQFAGLEGSLTDQPTSTLDALSSASAQALGAPVRPLLFLLLGLLAFYPLYLLNLAFGGRNTYWRAISLGVLLLFLPTLLEGLGGLLGWLGDLTGLVGLRPLSNLSLYQGAWGLPLLALLVLAAIGLTSYGFRGLCRQFGLLGSSSASRSEAQPALEWDEEL
ncbi:hypothetical protein [Deinococcus sonorensis]|uniref:Uncharacterized protein n=2 Tax=Deinococcus sonorensis TaxID=309891 RepID=A0AAU7UEH8_9DEIO